MVIIKPNIDGTLAQRTTVLFTISKLVGYKRHEQGYR